MDSKNYNAKIVCDYEDDGTNLKVDFKYSDSNGANVQTSYTSKDIELITDNIINDIITALINSNEKAKKPEEMTREELLEALKLMEKEANEQRTKNDMLEKRLAMDENRKAKPDPATKPETQSGHGKPKVIDISDNPDLVVSLLKAIRNL